MAADMHRTVDLGGIALAAAPGTPRSDAINNDLFAIADPAFEPPFRNELLVLHQAVPALLFDFVWYRRREIIRGGAGDRFVAETTHAIELRLGEPIQQLGKV